MTTTLVLGLGLILVLAIELSHAQNSAQDYIDAHNAARAEDGVGPIEWSDDVAAYAEQYASVRMADCALQHSEGPYGENIAWSSGSQMTATEAVQMWVDEKVDYDYASNTCASGKVCGHYTQVVWKNSVRLGCARVECSTGGTFITCNYDPPGNFVGEWPY